MTTGTHGRNAPQRRSDSAPLIFVDGSVSSETVAGVNGSVSFETDVGLSNSATVTLPACFSVGDADEEDDAIMGLMRGGKRDKRIEISKAGLASAKKSKNSTGGERNMTPKQGAQ